MKTVAKMMRMRIDKILNYFTHWITNAKAEGINSKIALIEKNGLGFQELRPSESNRIQYSNIAVESKNHLITYYTIDNSTNDYASVFPLSKGTKEFIDRFSISSDKGHFSLPNLLSLAQEGIEAFIPSPQRGTTGKRREVPKRDYHRSRFLYDPLKDTYRCPEGNEIHYRFSTPNSTRPEIVYRVYTTDACFTCAVKNRCTNSVRRKWMERWEHADVEDQHWKRMNSRGVEKMILRKRTVEHPFGTIKRAMNQGYFLLKGLRKVKSEFGFSVIAYNMKRAISIKGVRPLIQSL